MAPRSVAQTDDNGAEDFRRIRRDVRAYRRRVEDPEEAHWTEDRIHEDALRWVADHSTDERARDVAALALSTLDVDIPRWYA